MMRFSLFLYMQNVVEKRLRFSTLEVVSKIDLVVDPYEKSTLKNPNTFQFS